MDARKLKGFQLQRGFAPLTPDQGLCPWTPLGLRPQTPVIGDPRYKLALRALAMCPSRTQFLDPPVYRVE